MTRRELRRPIPHSLVALSVCTLALLSGLSLAPATDVAADTAGGQASIYGGIPQTFNICTGFEPPFFNAFEFQTPTGRQILSSRLIVFNPRTSSVTFNLRATADPNRGGLSFSRAITIPGNTAGGNPTVFIGAFDPEWTPGTTPGGAGSPRSALPAGFHGTIRAFNCEQLRLPSALEVGVATTTLVTPVALAPTEPSAVFIEESSQESSAQPGSSPGEFIIAGNVFTPTPTPTRIPTVTPTPTTRVSFVAAFIEPASGCAIASPLFANRRDGVSSTLVIRNEGDTAGSLDVRIRAHGGGALITRNFDLAPHGTLTLTGAQLSLPDGFAGSVLVNACPPRTNSTDLSGVVFHDSDNGDRSIVEAISEIKASGNLFVPVAHNDDNGFNTQLIVQNTHPDNDLIVKLEVHPDGAVEIDRSVTVRAESATVVDLTGLPKGAMSIKIEAPTGAIDPRLLAATYTTGPGGLALANNALTLDDSASNVALPLIFRAAGQEGGYDSIIRVMKVGPGALQPRITVRDRDTNQRMGPISATRPDGSPIVLREDEGVTWEMSRVSGLTAGRIYAVEVDSEDGGALVALSGYLNMTRGTAGGYSGVSKRDAPRFYTAPVVVKNVSGLNTGIELQELVGRDQSALIRAFDSRGNRVATLNVTIPDSGSATVYLPAEADLPDGTYSAEISSTDRIGVVVNTVRYR
jgi:hypothetical protein